MSEKVAAIASTVFAVYAAVYFTLTEDYGLAGFCAFLTLVGFWTTGAVWDSGTFEE